MKAGTLFVLAALVAAGAGGNLHGAEPEPLQLGAEVRGEITTAYPLNHSDGSRSSLYRVQIEEGQLVTFEVSGSLRAQLSLFDGDALVTRTADRQPASLSLRAARSAPYTLAVSGADADAFGPFTLRSRVGEGWDGQALRPGDAISDWTDAARTLALQVEREGLYAIDLRSDEFDAVLRVEGNGIFASDDDGGQGTDARLNLLLAPGRYELIVDGLGGTGLGLYRLSVTALELPANLNQGGRIRADGPELQGVLSGAPLRYHFSLPARRLVTIDMRSEHFDPLLLLRGNGQEHVDDDGGDGLDARLVQVLDAGDYAIDASAATGGGGVFSLSLATGEVPEGLGGGPLASGQERIATLLPGAVDRHAVTLAEGAEVVIEMGSSDFDSYLRVLDAAGEELASDDDSGGGLDARIRTRLAPGDYVVEASSIDGSGGSYRISLQAR